MRLIDADALMESIRKALGIKSMTKSLLLPAERTIIDQIDSAPTVGGWISVKDKLPERYERVLTYDERCGVKENWAIRLKPYVDWSQGYHITHWMPLPEPPKEESDD